jgi:Bacteriophage head to tail connecting protein
MNRPQAKSGSAAESVLAGDLLRRFRRAKQARGSWEGVWQDCYDFALPQRQAVASGPGIDRRGERLFDGTAPDAADQLAASLMSQLVPPWTRWFGLQPGTEVPEESRTAVGEVLEKTVATLQGHFDRSNFAVEAHQCFLDLVVAGTATLQFEEAAPGNDSAFRFACVPLAQVYVEEGGEGRPDTVFRVSEIRADRLVQRFPRAELPDDIKRDAERVEEGVDRRHSVVEIAIPEDGMVRYTAVLDTGANLRTPTILAEGRFAQSPFMVFRWLKAPGEVYGRSPVMKALPDIKTANKVVELVLKNASIAVTGIWQADDDGVLNPANIKLLPGTIIPKAVGSAGLTPLEAPGRFDVSNLVLEDLRKRIRHALLADRLGAIEGPKMTATEVLERSAEMARILGATYGRLQSELLTPLVGRAISILRRRGVVPPMVIDGRVVELQYKSPLARVQSESDVRNAIAWIQQTSMLGPEAMATVDAGAAARWIARAMGVPADIIKPPAPAPDQGGIAAALGGAAGGPPGPPQQGAPQLDLGAIASALGAAAPASPQAPAPQAPMAPAA